MERCRARSIVLLLDCCYSGAFLSGSKGDEGVHLKEKFSGRGKAILTASNAIEYAWVGDELSGDGQPSLFTAAIVDGLRTGEADRDGDGALSIGDLYEHVCEQVADAKRGQTPLMWAEIERNLYIARTPHPPLMRNPVASPREVAEADLWRDSHGLAGVALASGASATEELTTQRHRFRERLRRSRIALSRGMAGLLTRGVDDEEAWEELEKALLAADFGVAATIELVERLRTRARAERAAGAELRTLLRAEVRALLDAVVGGDRSLALDLLEEHEQPGIVLVVGVNGTGKTATIGKLAMVLADKGRQPVLVAADTSRAAATEQLLIWGRRVGARVIDGLTGAAYSADVALVDTPGRLDTKTNLMQQLGTFRLLLEQSDGHISEVLLVLDATAGQSGLAQAREFIDADALGVTGVVLTKLDITARAGIAVAVQRDLGIPIKLVGFGEGLYDLAPFDPETFVDALLPDDEG
jgi:fused signal recognition particle receptor